MSDANHDQEEFWTTNAGPLWVAQEGLLDAFLAPVLSEVLTTAGIGPDQSVLDIGCGTGHSTLKAARLVGPGGFALGADISATMIARAKTRAVEMPQAHFSLTDVADHSFEPDQFDHAISRFGVMFFANSVAAFRNIATALKPGAQITFATWGQIQNNPWFTLPARIAKEALGTPPKSDPDAPGPFAFRDIDKVCGLLRSAGLSQVSGTAYEIPLSLPGGAAQIAALSRQIGPAKGTIAHFQADDAAQSRIEDAMAKAFGAFDGAGIPAEINLFTATKS